MSNSNENIEIIEKTDMMQEMKSTAAKMAEIMNNAKDMKDIEEVRGLMDKMMAAIQAMSGMMGMQDEEQKNVEATPIHRIDSNVDLEKAVWTTAYMNTLPDSSFLYIEAGGKKDSEGKTEPRSLRHFPYKDASGKVDLPHLRNALARIPQSSLPQGVKDEVTAKARRIASENGIGTSAQNKVCAILDIVKAIEINQGLISDATWEEVNKMSTTIEETKVEKVEETVTKVEDAVVTEKEAVVEEVKATDVVETPVKEIPVTETPKVEESTVLKGLDEAIDKLNAQVERLTKLEKVNAVSDGVPAKETTKDEASTEAPKEAPQTVEGGVAEVKPEEKPVETSAEKPVEKPIETPKVEAEALNKGASPEGALETILEKLGGLETRLKKIEDQPAPSKILSPYTLQKGQPTEGEADELKKIDTRLGELGNIRANNLESYQLTGLADEAFRLIKRKKELVG